MEWVLTLAGYGLTIVLASFFTPFITREFFDYSLPPTVSIIGLFVGIVGGLLLAVDLMV